MKRRNIICSYCHCQGHASSEHAIPKWTYRYTAQHIGVTPARRVHKWGGAPTLRDVCKRCNNGPLALLDRSARRIVERAQLKSPLLTADEAKFLARWGAKVAFNMQRLCFREGTQGQECVMPASAVKWMLEDGDCDSIRVAVSWIELPDPVRENFGVFGSNGTPLPRRYVQAGPIVLFVAWDHSQVPGSAMLVHERDCQGTPAVAVSHPVSEPIQVPIMMDTSVLLKGLSAMPEIANEIVRRLS